MINRALMFTKGKIFKGKLYCAGDIDRETSGIELPVVLSAFIITLLHFV